MPTETRPALSQTRRAVTMALSGLELPDCFAAATVASAINAQDRNSVAAKASRRRLVSKAYRLSGVA